MNPVVQGPEDGHRQAEVVGRLGKGGSPGQGHLAVVRAGLTLGPEQLGRHVALRADVARVDGVLVVVVDHVEAVDVNELEVPALVNQDVAGVPIAQADARAVEELGDGAELLERQQRAAHALGAGAGLAGEGERLALGALHEEAAEVGGVRFAVERLDGPGHLLHGVAGLAAEDGVGTGHDLDLFLAQLGAGAVGVIDLGDHPGFVAHDADGALRAAGARLFEGDCAA